MSDFLLEIRNASKTFKPEVFQAAVHSLKGVSLGFPQGHCTGLVGHNGAGKTTAIRMILGLISPTRGEVLFRGKPMTRQSRSSIGYLAESVKFPAGLTCQEILMTHLSLFDIKSAQTRKQLVAEKLEQVGLTYAKRRTASFLS
ncbi:MAG: ATP-binding cassette domain-containing protein, partial [Proteobacteria bacterium]|nr:ATP-binding cassette domain-containing protein [Pseudomonadota bacterium]